MMAQDGTTPEPRRRSDGRQTHAEILDTAMRLASVEGLGSLTFGRLARELEISKSGVFAHFRSKQQLKEETVQAGVEVFEDEVLQPGLAAPEGLARIESLCEAYLSYIERGVFPGGCFLAQLLADFDALEGPIHDRLAAGQQGWLGLLEGQIEIAQQQGELEPSVDPGQLAFELYAPIEMANYLFTLFRDPTFVQRGREAVQVTLRRATPPPQPPPRAATSEPDG